jgi:hypothetical protein
MNQIDLEVVVANKEAKTLEQLDQQLQKDLNYYKNLSESLLTERRKSNANPHATH